MIRPSNPKTKIFFGIRANWKYLLGVKLFVVSTISSAQVLSGKVLDRLSQEPIPYASIYVNNSLRGTSSDEKGLFKLDISQLEGQEVVISCLGYKSAKLDKIEFGKLYVVYLQQQPVLLDEVVVIAETDDTPREVKIRTFLNEFIGLTKNSKKCIIKNIDDINLWYSKSSHTLVANSTAPLIIHNKSLGYIVTYFLEDFKRTDTTVFYRGYSIFKQDSTLSKHELNVAQRNRNRAYLGSRMHFLRTLWSNQLKNSSFEVVDGQSRIRPELNFKFVDKEKGLKSLVYSGKLEVMYKNSQVSNILFKDNCTVVFNRNGYFDPSGHSWQGYMAIQRIGDLLPYEYRPKGRY